MEVVFGVPSVADVEAAFDVCDDDAPLLFDGVPVPEVVFFVAPDVVAVFFLELGDGLACHMSIVRESVPASAAVCKVY